MKLAWKISPPLTSLNKPHDLHLHPPAHHTIGLPTNDPAHMHRHSQYAKYHYAVNILIRKIKIGGSQTVRAIHLALSVLQLSMSDGLFDPIRRPAKP